MNLHQTAIPPPAHAALFLDVDGTLIDIASRPDEVLVPPDLAPILLTAEDKLSGALALLSGRTIAELDHLLAPARLRASGVHGAEFRFDPGEPAETSQPLPADLVQAIRQAAGRFPGTLVEDKGPTLAVHFRAAPAAEAKLRVALMACLAAHGESDAELMTGDQVFETKPPGLDKGTALRRFMAQPPFAGRVPIFISDHPIDEAGFVAASALGGLAFSVGSRLTGTNGHFSGPTEVRAWLKDFGA